MVATRARFAISKLAALLKTWRSCWRCICDFEAGQRGELHVRQPATLELLDQLFAPCRRRDDPAHRVPLSNGESFSVVVIAAMV